MKIILYLSDYIIPLTIFYIVSFGLLMKRPVYDDFVKGAKEGARTVAGIMPTLVGLMVGVGVLRASGFLDALAVSLGQWTQKSGFPSQLLPVALVKLFSSSAATGLALDLFKEYGPDSELGLMTSLMLSCTETVFYTMSIYCVSAGIKKTRYTLPGALLATFAGIIMSVVLGRSM
ncbi:MAG: spore maturation protein [Hungatella sp.]|jgi:spore maturation protein B|nr:spore maturation protein [Hungatella sp.]